ncbi:diphthamide biosynthesis protein 3 [Strigomonas culicis]|uniref:Diphthamide biosynthesis protein 3 n=1 Tax=Strigomonas culicis TaxID=28005 RepID=S9UQC1_9TRYP|nr:diphthamide biosynthesis protein 3 [Strigomonas culicis]|eukprot:EPY31048.1 diphthamide biosynthesis protein 3 [Strigomonas culicis]
MDEFHYEEVNLGDMMFEDDKLLFPCPCGDLFELSLEAFLQGANVAQCPTCSLTVKIIFTQAEKNSFLSKFDIHASAMVAVA